MIQEVSSQLLPLLAAADAPGASLDSAVVTVGGLLAFLWTLSLVLEIWQKLKPQPPPDEKYASAESFHEFSQRCATDLVRSESNCLGKIADLAKLVETIQEDRKRSQKDIWDALRANERTVQLLSNDLSRALGRLEGRADVMDALRAALPKQLQPGEKANG